MSASIFPLALSLGGTILLFSDTISAKLTITRAIPSNIDA